MRTRLRPDEELLAVVRRHWIVLGGPLAGTLLLLGCLIGALYVGRPWAAPAAGIALAIGLGWAAWRWLDWRCDLWAITSQRVIDESGVLSVRTIDSPLDRIENVTCLQSLWGRIMGYGTLNVQTAAEVGSTTIECVTRPMELKEMILGQQSSRSRGTLRRTGRGAGAADVPDAGAAEVDRECPYCAEIIKVRARVCRFCGRNVS